MKIVIDIPEENYEVLLTKIMLACRGCKITELVKKHGRLIDADKLIKKLEATANIEWNKQVGSSKGLEDAIDIIDDDVPTIIEADKESD